MYLKIARQSGKLKTAESASSDETASPEPIVLFALSASFAVRFHSHYFCIPPHLRCKTHSPSLPKEFKSALESFYLEFPFKIHIFVLKSNFMDLKIDRLRTTLIKKINSTDDAQKLEKLLSEFDKNQQTPEIVPMTREIYIQRTQAGLNSIAQGRTHSADEVRKRLGIRGNK